MQVSFKFVLDVEEVYILQRCMFICFIIKAVHLEAVYDLSSNSFISTLDYLLYIEESPKSCIVIVKQIILERDTY